MMNRKTIVILHLFLLIFPALLFSSPIGLEIQSGVYYGLPVKTAGDIFYTYDAPDNVLDFRFDLGYLVTLKIMFEKAFVYASIINQHNFFTSTDQAFIDQFYEPAEYATASNSQIDFRKYDMAYALGYGISLLPVHDKPVFNIDLAASLFLHILGEDYQLLYADSSSYATSYRPEYAVLELHMRVSAYYRILSWLKLASCIDICAANLNLYFVPQFIGGSNYFNIDVVFSPLSAIPDLGFSLSFLCEFCTYNDTTDYNILPGFDSKDMVMSPGIGIGISYGIH